MAAIIKGDAYLFGVAGTITNAAVQSVNVTKSFSNVTEVKDENGNVVSRRYDDKMEEGTIEIIIASGYSIPDQGDQLSYDSVTYEIVSVGKSESNGDHRKVSLNVKKSEYVTYA